MQNLEQIRAADALEPAKDLDRSAVNKLPAMIIANGLLATAAFCEAEGGGDNRSHMKRALDATTDHLSRRGLIAAGKTQTKDLIADIASRDSQYLQRASAEALAFIAYLKRFSKPDNK
ncbi:MAG: type III-B CRISPR module-associated protein Cmr5 [Candidatus Omnitrophica bacterium]|nr:type III-B CRISPR module-associated protein Cmr5 [Candidatus Omnitrophota bacterium]